MIQNINPKGSNFRNTVEYVLRESKQPEVILTNLEGESAKEISEELKSFSKLNPNLKKMVFHSSLSLPPGEKLSNEEWAESTKKYLDELGFGKSGYIVVKHNDEDHDHVHIVASRTDINGKTVPDSWDYKRGEKICREIEMDYSLQRVSPSNEREMNGPSKGEFRKMMRTGEVSAKVQMQDLIPQAAQGNPSFTEFVERLDALEIKVIPNASLKTGRVSGISYELNDEILKGSTLGRKFSFKGIQEKLGVEYDKDRDFRTIEREKIRSELKNISRSDGNYGENEITRCGNLSESHRAISNKHGADSKENRQELGRGLPENGREQRKNGNAFSETTRAAENDGEIFRLRSRETPGNGKEHSSNSKANELGNRPNNIYDRNDALSRIKNACDALDGMDPMESGSLEKDKAYQAMHEQMTRMRCEKFAIGAKQSSGKFINYKDYTIKDLPQITKYLKHKNAIGDDLYLKPYGNNQGLVLIDDVTRKSVEQMKKDGHTPAIVLETSPRNHQVWIRYSEKELTDKEYKMISKGLSEKYGGDMASIDSKHYGRLAGFINHKPEHNKDGVKPWVKIKDYCRKIEIEEGKENKREEIFNKVSEICNREIREERLQEVKKGGLWLGRNGMTELEIKFREAYREEYYDVKCGSFAIENGKEIDYSALDFRVCKKIMKRHQPKEEEMSQILEKLSPNIDTRKKGREKDYADRTVKAAQKSISQDNQRQQEMSAQRAAEAAQKQQANQMQRGFEMER